MRLYWIHFYSYFLPRRTHFNWKHGVMAAQENLGLFVWVRVPLLLLSSNERKAEIQTYENRRLIGRVVVQVEG